MRLGDRLIDSWQGELELGGDKIDETKCMRYLGVEINNKNTNADHFTKRRSKALAAMFKLKSIGVLNKQMHPNMRARLYKVYIRPVLWYGVESIYMKQSDILLLKRLEGNIVKTILGIHTRCKTTDLFTALNIDSTRDRLTVTKIDFYSRVIQNSYTKELLFFMETISEAKDLVNEIYELIDVLSMDVDLNLAEACQVYKLNSGKKNVSSVVNGNVETLRSIFNMKNETDMVKNIINIIKF
ncbi:unnamed protein product [Brachionus calyciflorus]|uniref:Uncharacterized protein n=1 Tax=Brachionus calyciflorus TaxID=104777 RepID=A0A814CQP1_9BILA|nr:unnamed protein product [Brachionus calyciflorus]